MITNDKIPLVWEGINEVKSPTLLRKLNFGTSRLAPLVGSILFFFLCVESSARQQFYKISLLTTAKNVQKSKYLV